MSVGQRIVIPLRYFVTVAHTICSYSLIQSSRASNVIFGEGDKL